MLFLIGFGWLVAASFAFLLAILTPNWVTVQPVSSVATSGSVNVQIGIFYVCNLLEQDSTYQIVQCASIIGVGSSTNSTGMWDYNLATAAASVAIGCASLSIIVLWLSGIYFHGRKQHSCTTCFLLSTCFLLLLTFCASFVVWILIISEVLKLGYTVNRSIFNWPMWVAVGATGGYLIALLSMLVSFCTGICRRRKTGRNLLYQENHF